MKPLNNMSTSHDQESILCRPKPHHDDINLISKFLNLCLVPFRLWILRRNIFGPKCYIIQNTLTCHSICTHMLHKLNLGSLEKKKIRRVENRELLTYKAEKKKTQTQTFSSLYSSMAACVSSMSISSLL